MSKSTYGNNSNGGMQTNAFTANLTAGTFTAAPQMVNDRLTYHKALLEAKGISSLSNLGTLRISGTIVPQSGVTKPGASIISGGTMVQSATRFVSSQKGSPTIRTFSGQADILSAIPFTSKDNALLSLPALATGADISIDTAYWVGSEVFLTKGTNIVLKYPHRYLIILAEKLIVEDEVTFSWERPFRNIPPQVTPAPYTPAGAPMSTSLVGIPGTDGTPGWTGYRGYDGASAPELEVWVLDMSGRPRFDLRGQDGTQGGQGQNGGNGGRGGKGKPSVLDWAGFCKAGAGAGGNGGNGGLAGSGGAGGNGGTGGRLSLYAPQAVLQQYLRGGFDIQINGGGAGAGGLAGVPGNGGPGGDVGDSKGLCSPGSRKPGQPGGPGAPGYQGPYGWPGSVLPNPVSFYDIHPDDFKIKMLEPAIAHVNPLYVKTGDRVTVEGKRFAMSDKIIIDGVEAATTVISDTLLQFTVPALYGGSRTIQARQADSTLSNRASIYILPQIMNIEQEGMEARKPDELPRIKPGMKVTLKGSSFEEGAIVLVNDFEMPDVRVINSAHIEFTMVRPSDTEINASGESVTLKVRFSDGTMSNTLQLELETFHMLVIGDSVSWGQGMQEHEKFYSLVGAAIQANNGNIKQYTSVLAHSGATIGDGDFNIVAPVSGEVPTSYPTILQQCDLFSERRDKVDLILLDGGMNDVDVRTVMDPFNPTNLDVLFEKHFNQSMYKLLDKVTKLYPESKVIVTGYYAPISRKSDLAAVEALLIALGILLGGAGGGTAGGVFGLVEFEYICNRCEKLESDSKMYLQQVIDRKNGELNTPPRIFFANPNFGPDHAALTNDPYLFGINLDLSPQDFIADDRLVSCTEAGCTGLEMEICKRASMGHPNPKGAQAYANAILPFL
ncbi:lysophospholipase L1-like esterase [Paenibacillus endophyticus]|uniref:Lysophospholipase L1-like esterase n=1 Tax=Paenibacillus endophyticus TaxID=1294268 RepID=A0A7W5C9W2_9BACL|nr:SGNH/GDSL hydrolase family protein [Paenibacillus endophyticus]MBB3153785.1 lysophospholipase L1-like esterase [Paenibacillus endophyticus]